jgi:hypothetical protein
LYTAEEHPEEFLLLQEKLRALYTLSEQSLQERLALGERLAKNIPETIQLFTWWIPGVEKIGRAAKNKTQAAAFFLFLEKILIAKALLRTPSVNARLILDDLFLALP